MKNLIYLVEVINDDSKLFVVRDPQGAKVIKVCKSTDELAQFFNDVEFKG